MTTQPTLNKVPTGTDGLDEILAGGLPAGRPSLVCGAAGCGKTLLSMQFLVRGALRHNEPGVFIAFEEREEDLRANVASLGFDLQDLEDRKLLSIDHIDIDPSTIIENGDYDLSGLFLRLGLAIDSIGAKRVVIDTLETLFGGLSNYGIIRAELRRLFDWLKERNVTAIITAEKGDNALTRHGLEEYVSDCVISLDHRVVEQVSTRRLRVVKYRGSVHGTNEYPFLIDETGISVLPITSAGLEHDVSDERISTGIHGLDEMLGGQGYFKGSTILISGHAGCGKTSIATHFAQSMCAAGKKVVYFSFEESANQIIRNMGSIGTDLKTPFEQNQLRFVSARATAHGLEAHLATLHKHIREFNPDAVILDPASTFINAGDGLAAQQMLIRLIDYLKSRQVTALLTVLSDSGISEEKTNSEISSIVDTWLLLKVIELAGERNRGIYVLKSRGMNHSNQIREFKITDRGILLEDVYVGMGGVLTGSARVAQEAREQAEARKNRALLDQAKRKLETLKAEHHAQLAKLEMDFANDSAEIERSISQFELESEQLTGAQHAMAVSRGASK